MKMAVTIARRRHNTNTDTNTKSFVLRFFYSIFFVAFASYYYQFPGLLSSSGIEPVGRIFPRVFPSFYDAWFLDEDRRAAGHAHDDFENTKRIWVEIDIFCECAAILGMVLSLIAAR